MLDHIFLTVGDLDRAIGFYETVLPILGINRRLDYDGNHGPAGHPDLKGFGADGRMFFWLRAGQPAPGAVHVDDRLWRMQELVAERIELAFPGKLSDPHIVIVLRDLVRSRRLRLERRRWGLPDVDPVSG